MAGANPIEIVMYLTARNETYRVLDGISGQFSTIGRNVQGLRAAFGDAEQAAVRSATAMQGVAAAERAIGEASRNWSEINALNARGITSLTQVTTSHAAAATRAADAINRLATAQRELSAIQAVGARASATAASIPLTGPYRQTAGGIQFPGYRPGQMVSQTARQAVYDDQMAQAAAADAAAATRLSAMSHRQRSVASATAAEQAAQENLRRMEALEAAGASTPGGAAGNLVAAREEARLRQLERQRAEQALLDNQAGIGRFALPLARTAALGLAMAGGAFYAHAIGNYDQFQTTLTQAKALGDPSLTAPQMRTLEDMVLHTSAATGNSPQSLAQAEYYAASAGIKPLQSQDILTAAGKDTFISGDKDTTTAIRALTNILNAYKMDPKQADQVNNELISAVRVANATFANFASGMGSVLAVAPQAGASLPDVLAAISSMTVKGVSPMESAQDVAALLRHITTTVPQQAQGLARDLGISIGPNALKSMQSGTPLTDWMAQVTKATGGDQMVLRALLVDQRAMRAFNDTGGGQAYRSQFVDPIFNPGNATNDAFSTVAQTQAGRTRLTMARLSAATTEAGRNAQGAWGAIQDFAAPALTATVSGAGGFAGWFGDMLTSGGIVGQNLLQGRGLSGQALQQSTFNRSYRDFIAGANTPDALKDQQAIAALQQQVQQDVRGGNMDNAKSDLRLLQSMQDVYNPSQGELPLWQKNRDIIRSSVDHYIKTQSPQQAAASIQQLMKQNPDSASGIAAYANARFHPEDGKASLVMGATTIRPQAPYIFGPPAPGSAQVNDRERSTQIASTAKDERTATALQRLHAMGVAEARDAQRELGHIGDWQSHLTQYNIASGQAELSTLIDSGASPAQIMHWVQATNTQIAKTPQSVQSARVTEQQQRAVKVQGWTAIHDQQALADQTAIKQSAWGESADQALQAQLAALDTDIAFFKKKGDLLHVAALQADKGIQRMMTAAETSQIALGTASQTLGHNQAMGVWGSSTVADINNETAAAVDAASKESGHNRAGDIQKAFDTGAEKIHNFWVQFVQNQADMANEALSHAQAMGMTGASLSHAIDAATAANVRAAQLAGGPNEAINMKRAADAGTEAHHVDQVNYAQAQAQRDSQRQGYDSSMGVSFEQQRRDIAATKKSAIEAAHVAKGYGEAGAVDAANQAAASGNHAIDIQVAQVNQQSAQTHMDAVQFEHGSIQDQKAAIHEWAIAARALATLQAGGNKTILKQLLGGVDLQEKQMNRAADTSQDQFIIQSAQINFDAALRQHASTDTLLKAADTWATAVEADIKARGLKGPELAAAEAQKKYTQDGMKIMAYQQQAAQNDTRIQADIAEHKSYGQVSKDTNAAIAWLNANGKKEGLSPVDIELQVANLKNTLLGYYQPKNPPTYVDRPYQQAVGDLTTGQGQGGVLFFGGMSKAQNNRSIEALMQTVSSLQLQLAASQQRLHYEEQMVKHLSNLDTKAGNNQNPSHAPGHLPIPIRGPKSFGVGVHTGR